RVPRLRLPGFDLLDVDDLVGHVLPVPGRRRRESPAREAPERMARITSMAETGTMRVKSGLAEMLKGGVIMDVTDADQARIAEGAAMIRTKGEAGTGDIVNAVTHMRSVFGHIRKLKALRDEELYSEAKEVRAPYELVRWVAENGRLPVVTFTAGGIATPADAALCMQLGADGVFVGSGIFKSGNPSGRAKAIVEATTHYDDAEILARVSRGLGDAMSGLSAAALAPEELLETRGW